MLVTFIHFWIRIALAFRSIYCAIVRFEFPQTHCMHLKYERCATKYTYSRLPLKQKEQKFTFVALQRRVDSFDFASKSQKSKCKETVTISFSFPQSIACAVSKQMQGQCQWWCLMIIWYMRRDLFCWFFCCLWVGRWMS